MRKFSQEEIETYNKVRARQPELNLPEYSDGFRVDQSVDGLLTLVKVRFADAGLGPDRMGRAVYSVIDRKIAHKPAEPAVGLAIAFNRALHSPILWD